AHPPAAVAPTGACRTRDAAAPAGEHDQRRQPWMLRRLDPEGRTGPHVL
ncbi:MAG: hypothetical protein AVDCRST_MAG77-3653, partial [uncultured Chloroflexi bacterium]